MKETTKLAKQKTAIKNLQPGSAAMWDYFPNQTFGNKFAGTVWTWTGRGCESDVDWTWT